MLSALVLTLALGAPGPQAGLRPLPLPPPPIAAFPAPEPPPLAARSWMVYSVNHGAEIGSKEPDLAMPPASITKLMTSMLAEAALDLTAEVTISATADATPIGFTGQPDVRQGEVWVARDLLANVMVQSGNDASTAIAEAVSGTSEAFVELMNATAAELGMANTTFRNPHGLDAPDHLTTARDLITMGRSALDHPVTMSLARTKHLTVDIAGRLVPIDATDRDLGVFPGLLGLKTGDTASAGQVLLSYTVTQHDQLIAVVLGTPDRRAATRALLAWAMGALGPRDRFFALAAESDLALGFPDWYRTRLEGLTTGLAPGTPIAPDRTPLTDDLLDSFGALLPQLLGGES
jgi:D-alanyl-D-alanine carboxypeptidase (penicillin-binding protein 5/6)